MCCGPSARRRKTPAARCGGRSSTSRASPPAAAARGPEPSRAPRSVCPSPAPSSAAASPRWRRCAGTRTKTWRRRTAASPTWTAGSACVLRRRGGSTDGPPPSQCLSVVSGEREQNIFQIEQARFCLKSCSNFLDREISEPRRPGSTIARYAWSRHACWTDVCPETRLEA